MIILSGRVSIKMAPVVRRVYDQMLEPRWVIAMGACSSSGGMFANYAVVQGADKFMPVDVHVPGCPPRAEALLHGFNKLQRLIQGRPDLGWRQRYNAIGTEEWARGETAADPRGDRARRASPWQRRGRNEMPDAPGLELIAQSINEAREGTVAETSFEHDRAALIVDPEGVTDALRWLRDDRGPGLHLPLQPARRRLPAGHPRFAVHYELLCRDRVERIRVKALLADPAAGNGSDALPEIPSCVELFPTAEFQEREAYDFFGIVFRGHPDLRRILMPEDYVGWPQRRDFPIGGEPVLYTHNEVEAPRWFE